MCNMWSCVTVDQSTWPSDYSFGGLIVCLSGDTRLPILNGQERIVNWMCSVKLRQSSFVWVVNHMNICTLVHLLKIIRESLVLGLLEVQ